MTSPCGKIRIPINESSDDKSQIAEYLDLYHGEGIQHIALGTDDIYATVDAMKTQRRRVPGHDRDLLRPGRQAAAEPRREPRRAEAPAHPDRRRHAPGRAERTAAADLHADRDRPDLLRDHPAQGRPGLRRRQLPRAVREHRARPDPPRRAGRQRPSDVSTMHRRQGRQPGRRAGHLRPRRPPAARRLRDARAPTTPASRTGRAYTAARARPLPPPVRAPGRTAAGAAPATSSSTR